MAGNPNALPAVAAILDGRSDGDRKPEGLTGRCRHAKDLLRTTMTTLIYIGNEHLIELDAPQNAADNSYLNAATVTVTIKNAAGVNISGETWPKTMTYVTASAGKYRATVSDALALVPGQFYIAHITAESGGLTGNWQIPLTAAIRNA
ncbi:MAG: hypothetical protein MZW92_31975 [Comamonadaceae bacterium]|nr:hypothetical protein [Comamonadaceae bacterium]